GPAGDDRHPHRFSERPGRLGRSTGAGRRRGDPGHLEPISEKLLRAGPAQRWLRRLRIAPAGRGELYVESNEGRVRARWGEHRGPPRHRDAGRDRAETFAIGEDIPMLAGFRITAVLLLGIPFTLVAEPVHIAGRVVGDRDQKHVEARIELLPQTGEAPVAVAKTDAKG